MEQIIKLQSLLNAISRWNEKANSYGISTDLHDQFDEFVTRYIVLATFSHVIKMEAGKKWGDRGACTIEMGKMLNNSHEHLYEQLTGKADELTQTLTKYGFKIDYAKQLRKAIQKQNPSDFVEKLLKVLYAMRCNLFHGEKLCIADQVFLLRPANTCLRFINDELKRVIESRIDNELQNVLR